MRSHQERELLLKRESVITNELDQIFQRTNFDKGTYLSNNHSKASTSFLPKILFAKKNIDTLKSALQISCQNPISDKVRLISTIKLNFAQLKTNGENEYSDLKSKEDALVQEIESLKLSLCPYERNERQPLESCDQVSPISSRNSEGPLISGLFKHDWDVKDHHMFLKIYSTHVETIHGCLLKRLHFAFPHLSGDSIEHHLNRYDSYQKKNLSAKRRIQEWKAQKLKTNLEDQEISKQTSKRRLIKARSSTINKERIQEWKIKKIESLDTIDMHKPHKAKNRFRFTDKERKENKEKIELYRKKKQMDKIEKIKQEKEVKLNLKEQKMHSLSVLASFRERDLAFVKKRMAIITSNKHTPYSKNSKKIQASYANNEKATYGQPTASYLAHKFSKNSKEPVLHISSIPKKLKPLWRSEIHF